MKNTIWLSKESMIGLKQKKKNLLDNNKKIYLKLKNLLNNDNKLW